VVVVSIWTDQSVNATVAVISGALNVGMSQLNSPMSLQQLESYLWGAATILRGLIDAGDYKQFIFPLVFYKRLSDVWDEDYAQALTSYADDAQLARAEADERFRVPAGAHWNQVRTVAKDVGKDILKSLDPRTGRCAILFPHGVLFRKGEGEMRRKLIEANLVDCVLGLGPNPETAQRLDLVFGGTSRFWLTREAPYRAALQGAAPREPTDTADGRIVLTCGLS